MILSGGKPAWPVAYLPLTLLALSATALASLVTRPSNAATFPLETLFMFDATLSGEFTAPARKSWS